MTAALDAHLATAAFRSARGPLAVIFAEDAVEVASTVAHHRGLGFPHVLVLAPARVALPEVAVDVAVDVVAFDPFPEGAVARALGRITDAAAGRWLHWCYNAEYLLYPFCETRPVAAMLAFQAEERREAVPVTVVDLYAPDLGLHPGGVDRATAAFDRTGYYALARTGPAGPLDRQRDLYGGLRRRFEEHVIPGRGRIDRASLFRARKGLAIGPDLALSDPEMMTAACPWHHSLTAAVASFRAAKALRANPASREAVTDFHWFGTEPFAWGSRQLMDAGLMEPGQWF